MKKRRVHRSRQDFIKSLLKTQGQVLVVAGNPSNSKLMKELASYCASVKTYKRAGKEGVTIMVFNRAQSKKS